MVHKAENMSNYYDVKFPVIFTGSVQLNVRKRLRTFILSERFRKN